MVVPSHIEAVRSFSSESIPVSNSNSNKNSNFDLVNDSQDSSSLEKHEKIEKERENEKKKEKCLKDNHNQFNEEYNFEYDRFLLRMKHPDCRHIITRIKYFIHEFNKWSDNDQEKPIKYKEFMEWTGEALSVHPVWQAAPLKYRQDIKEGLEYLIMNQVYSSAFAPMGDREADNHLSLQLHRHKWVNPEHLDISFIPIDDQVIKHAKLELENLINLTTPRDKLFCIMTFCRIIESSLEIHDRKMDADKLMPLIIFTLLRIQPRYLISHMRYVQRYRATVHFKSEVGYHFTNLMAAITFIERINRDALVLATDELDYEEKIKEMGEYKTGVNDNEALRGASNCSFDNSSCSLNNNHDINSNSDSDDHQSHYYLADDKEDKNEDDILEEGKKAFHRIKSSQLVSKSVKYLREMMNKAEEAINDALKEAISDDITPPPSRSQSRLKTDNGNYYKENSKRSEQEETKTKEESRKRQEEEEEEEFQLQLAMALSLSEQEQYFDCHSKQFQKLELSIENKNENKNKDGNRREQFGNQDKDGNEKDAIMKKRSLSI